MEETYPDRVNWWLFLWTYCVIHWSSWCCSRYTKLSLPSMIQTRVFARVTTIIIIEHVVLICRIFSLVSFKQVCFVFNIHKNYGKFKTILKLL